MTHPCHAMTHTESDIASNAAAAADHARKARLKRAEYMLLISSKFPKDDNMLLGDFGLKQVLICHRELAAADGDLGLLCGIIARYKRVQPHVISHLLLEKRYTYTPYPFVNRNIRIALSTGSTLA